MVNESPQTAHADADARHPIHFVCRRTGLTAHVIRAWEKRYAAVVPSRTGTNRRLYSDADIDRLKLLARLVAEGHSIGQIANLDRERLEKILSASSASAPVARAGEKPGAAGAGELLARTRDAVAQGDGDALFDALSDASVRLSQPVLFAEVIGPLLQWIGDAWHSGALRIADEHIATSVLRDFLAELRRKHRPRIGATAIVIATPAGDQHEFGALLASISAASDGWRDVYLGCNMPWQEIAKVADTVHAAAIALSLAYPGDAPPMISEIEKLRRYVPETVPIFVGGSGAANQRARLEDLGIRVPDSLDDFRAALAELRQSAVTA